MTTKASPLNNAWIWSAQDFNAPELFTVSAGTMAIYTARAPGKSTVSEDAVAFIPLGGESCVLAVADGLGGLPGGAAASRMAVDTLRARLTASAGDPPTLMQTILDAINEANRRLLAECPGAATTLAVAEVQGDTVRTYHVGDSMILVTDQRGNIKLQTVAHSPVGYAVEAGLLNEVDAIHHAQRHLVANVVGMEDMRIEVSPSLRLARHDTLIVASDGLPDNLYIHEIVERMRSDPLDKAARRLLEDGHRRMQGEDPAQPSHADDLSFILLRPGASSTEETHAGG